MTTHDRQGDGEHNDISGHDTKHRPNEAPLKTTLATKPAVGLRAVALNIMKSKCSVNWHSNKRVLV